LQRLRPGIDSQQLQAAVSAFGKVVKSTVISNASHGRIKGFAFCELETEDAADAAIQGLNGNTELGDPHLIVSHAVDRVSYAAPPVPTAASIPGHPSNPTSFGLPWPLVSAGARMSQMTTPNTVLMTPYGSPADASGASVAGAVGPGSYWARPSMPGEEAACAYNFVGPPTTIYVRPIPEEMDEYELWNHFLVSQQTGAILL